jgi:hypothetical protein
MYRSLFLPGSLRFVISKYQEQCMTEKEYRLAYGKLVSRVWEDDDFKKRFIAAPVEVMAEFGIQISPEEGVVYKVIEAPRLVQYIVLPHEKSLEAIQQFTKILLQKVDGSDTKLLGEGVELRIIQNTKTARYLVLPFPPQELTLRELSGLGIKVGDNMAVSHALMVHDMVSVIEAVTEAGVATEVGVAAFAVIVLI